MGSVAVARRAGREVVELAGQGDQVAHREGRVHRHALDHRADERIERERVVLGLGLVDDGPEEGVLPLDATEITGPVVLPIAVLLVLVVPAAGQGQGVPPVDQLAAGLADVEAGIGVLGRIGEVELDAADGVDRAAQTLEVDLHHVFDGNAEVRLDGLHQLVGPGVVRGVDPVVLADLTGVPCHRDHGVAGDGQHADLTGGRNDVHDLHHIAPLATGVGLVPEVSGVS